MVTFEPGSTRSSEPEPSDASQRELPSTGAARHERVGIFGGSFDPVHRGHLHAALAAQRAHALDRVVFVPAAQPPHKSGRTLAPGRHRVAMLERAISPAPGFEIDTLELERGGTSYTIDTVRAMRQRLGPDVDLYLILGADNLTGFAEWRDVGALLALVQPIVVHRELDARRATESRRGPSPARDPETERALAVIRDRLGEAAAQKLEHGYLSVPPVRVSSTDLRAELPDLALECRDLPPAVLEYIRAEHLYGSGGAR